MVCSSILKFVSLSFLRFLVTQFPFLGTEKYFVNLGQESGHLSVHGRSLSELNKNDWTTMVKSGINIFGE